MDINWFIIANGFVSMDHLRWSCWFKLGLISDVGTKSSEGSSDSLVFRLRSKTLMQRSTQHKLERSNQSTHSECWLTLNLFKKFPHSDTSLHSLTGAAVPLVSMCLGIKIPSSVITVVLSSHTKFSFHSFLLQTNLTFLLLKYLIPCFLAPIYASFKGESCFHQYKHVWEWRWT